MTWRVASKKGRTFTNPDTAQPLSPCAGQDETGADFAGLEVIHSQCDRLDALVRQSITQIDDIVGVRALLDLVVDMRIPYEKREGICHR